MKDDNSIKIDASKGLEKPAEDNFKKIKTDFKNPVQQDNNQQHADSHERRVYLSYDAENEYDHMPEEPKDSTQQKVTASTTQKRENIQTNSKQED